MSATYARVTLSLPCGNPNASRTDERPVQLTWTDGHVDNPDFLSCNSIINSELSFLPYNEDLLSNEFSHTF